MAGTENRISVSSLNENQSKDGSDSIGRHTWLFRGRQYPVEQFRDRKRVLRGACSISRAAVSFRPRTSLTVGLTSPCSRPFFHTPCTPRSLRGTVGFNTPDALETPAEQKMLRRASRHPPGIQRRQIYASSEAVNINSLGGEWEDTVARTLVVTTASVITQLDNPQWFKTSAWPYVFSRWQDCRGLGGTREAPTGGRQKPCLRGKC